MRSYLLLASTAVILTPGLFAQAPVLAGVGNSGDYAQIAAPGGLVSLFGTNLASGTAIAPGVPLPVEMLGASVMLQDGSRVVSLPLYFVSPEQINAQLPYDITSATVQLRVSTTAGTSGLVPLNVSAREPRFLTVTEDGLGRPLILKPDSSLITRTNPLRPADYGQLYLIGLGAVNPPVPEGAAPGDGSASKPLNTVTDTVSLLFNGQPVETSFAGLAPGWPGLYQVNFRMPSFNVAGDVSIGVKTATGTGTTQTNITTSVEPDGFYWVVNSSKFPNGQTLNGVTGTTSAIAFRHDAASVWGNTGLRSWTRDTGLQLSAISGVALTIRNGSTVVYDNNGIDNPDSTVTSYYNNTSGNDDDKPGLYMLFSNSNNSNAVFAGSFRLSQAVTFTSISGYFDCNGNSTLPFHPDNPYNKFRMNIWSDTGSGPRETGNFNGDIWTTETTTGTFQWAQTTVSRGFADGQTDPICSLTFTPAQAQTLSAGDYWFGHDVAVPNSGIPVTPADSKIRAVSSVRVPRPDSLLSIQR